MDDTAAETLGEGKLPLEDPLEEFDLAVYKAHDLFVFIWPANPQAPHVITALAFVGTTTFVADLSSGASPYAYEWK
jgi:hypothetical protein